MLNFATEIKQVVQGLGTLDTVATKIASVEGSATAQRTVAVGSFGLYEVLTKKASLEIQESVPHHHKMVTLVNKLASVLGRPGLSPQDNLEMASTIVVDDAISSILLEKGANVKLAEMRAFGREYFVELLRKAL